MFLNIILYHFLCTSQTSLDCFFYVFFFRHYILVIFILLSQSLAYYIISLFLRFVFNVLFLILIFFYNSLFVPFYFTFCCCLIYSLNLHLSCCGHLLDGLLLVFVVDASFIYNIQYNPNT